MSPAEAAALHRLAELRAARARAGIGRLAARASELREAADAVWAAAAPDEAPPAGPAEALARERWRHWAGARRAELLQSLALAEAELAEARRAGARDLGREAVAAELLRRARAEARDG
jgi:hypothetical protein